MVGLMKKVMVSDDERVLLFKHRQFQSVLQPGYHRFFDGFNRLSFDVFRVQRAGIVDERLDQLLKLPEFSRHVDVFVMQENEVGVVYVQNVPQHILAPGARWVNWKDAFDTEVKTFPLDQLVEMDRDLLSSLLREKLDRCGSQQCIQHALVPDGHIGLLFENGTLNKTLEPGRYGYWAFNREVQIEVFDLRLQMVDISGQEILTRDRVSLRINLNAVYQYSDAVKAAMQLKNASDYIYRRLQLSLREVVGTRTLDELLADKQVISGVIFDDCCEFLKGYGIALDRVGVKDIILPGDMKDILNQVVQAQKSAEANLIKRREETAATRSLSNTAKMMEKNGMLLRLKELETLEKVAERIDHISVYGGLDAVMNDLVRLSDKRPSG